jgi:hypothetical protein
MKQTLCFINGCIHTVDPSLPNAEAVVSRGNTIVFVGSSADARSASGSSATIIDLAGRCVLPGFADDHTHFVQGGMFLQGIDLRSCTSTAAFKERIGAYAAAHRGTWITGGDWDQEKGEVKRLPRREWVDSLTPDTPVFVNRLDGHMALANSAALRLAGITAATRDPDGGMIERDRRTQEPTGILKDMAMELVLHVIPPPTEARLESAVLRALAEARRLGVTSIHDISAPEHIPVFRKLERTGKLSCRIYARLPLAGYRELVQQGIRAAHGTQRLTLGSMKAFSDGSLGSGTALFFDSYTDEPGNRGLAMDVLTSGKLREWAIDADRNGLQLSIHAIGDRANDMVLSIFEEIVRVNPPWDRRFRIEHAQHVRFGDFARLARLGVIVSAQPYHCVDDGVWAEQRIGPERARTTYAFKSFLDLGVKVCFGSDWTVAPLDPIAGIAAAVTRRTLDGKRPEGWIPEQKVTVEEAVRCYTINNAFASFAEDERGSITPGKLADLVVLDNDPFSVEPSTIGGVRVEMTVMDGEIVFGK